MAVSPLGGFGSTYISSLAQAYRQEVVRPSATAGAENAVRAAEAGAAGAGGAARAGGVPGADIAQAAGNALKQVEALDRTATDKAVAAATGDLTDIHDYVVAATEAQTMTELTTTVRNKALEAFNEIMRMPL